MDTVIFSGRVSKAEMLHERRRWYDRLVKAGKLDEFRVRDEWFRWKNIAKIVRLLLLRPRPRAAGADHLRDGLAAGALRRDPSWGQWSPGDHSRRRPRRSAGRRDS